MKHAASRALLAYWNECRGDRAAPARHEIEPSAIRSALGDVFILGYEPEKDHPIRLAGTRICAVFGRELKQQSFTALWDQADRSYIRELLGVVAEEMMGVLAGVTGKTADGRTVTLEVLILPLANSGEPRLIGVMAPLTVPFWIGSTPILGLTLNSLRYIDPTADVRKLPQLVAIDDAGQARTGLTVYEGGRQ